MAALIRAVFGKVPRLAPSVYLAETAVVVGDVELADDVSIWFGTVLRGDVGWIRVGARTNVQDLSMLHMSLGISNTELAEDVTVGHGAMLHGARVGSGALIGMGAILLDNVVIGEECLVAAGSLVPSGMKVEARRLVRGSPARVIRELDAHEWAQGRTLAARYVSVAQEHARAALERS